MPAPRPRVHPRGLLPRLKAEAGVCQQETVFRTGSQKKVIIVTAIETVGTQHSLPGSVDRPDVVVEVTKDNSLVHLRHSHHQGMQVLVEFVLRHIRARHWGSVNADEGSELVSSKRQAEAHQEIIGTLR
ncbi:unnamed protein product [Schistocephalus solidus]|uniref:Uncharacterized protein n=1 Tax=Schistocephalus solidus TaxID=70667 RepID=A0A183SZL8_SCHSO|nr:unnamed protein product [Schistocephalus solidus]